MEWPADGGNLSGHFAIRNSGHSLVAEPFEFNYNGGGDLSGFEILHHSNKTGITLENNFWNTYTDRVNHSMFILYFSTNLLCICPKFMYMFNHKKNKYTSCKQKNKKNKKNCLYLFIYTIYLLYI